MDESPAAPMKSRRKKALGPTKGGQLNLVKAPESALRSILPIVSANGQVVFTIFIFRDPRTKDTSPFPPIYIRNEERNYKDDGQFYYSFTKNGYITTELWRNIITKFLERTKEVRIGKRALLLVDRHSTHLDIFALQELAENGVDTIFFPAKTTHWTQPLDNLILANLKKVIDQKLVRFVFCNLIRGRKPLSPLQHVVQDSVEEALTPAVIRKAFEETGVHPFSRHVIEEKAQIFLASEQVQSASRSDDDVIDLATSTFTRLLHSYTPPRSSKRGRFAERAQLDTSAQMIARHEQLEQERKTELEQKELEREEKQQRKQQEADNRRKAIEDRQNQRQQQQEARRRKEADRKNRNRCGECDMEKKKQKVWWVCSLCDAFGLCRSCMQTPSNKGKHTRACKRARETLPRTV